MKNVSSVLSVLSLLAATHLAPHLACAQVTIVNPSRGGGLATNAPMIHADILYDAAKNTLQAQVDTSYERPRLRPLPAGYTFDPETKYRVLLDKNYNFQYAWNPGGIFTPPPGGAIWIECLRATPGLETYDGPGNKTENPPRPYTPIFGTAGSPSMWKWYGRMAHNTYAIRNPVTNVITAEYRLFIGDAQTGSRAAFETYPETTVTLTWDIDPSTPANPFLAGGQASGEMIHIDLSFDENAGRMNANVDTTLPVPELLPLLPTMAFDPAQKFSVLNHKHYNSQYGWNIGGFFSLPPGSAIWIEQLGASPGLEVYESNGVNGSYTPIFGTAGGPLKWKWSGSMVHNTCAVLNPCRDRYSAEYRVYIGDALTGSREAYANLGDATVRLVWAAKPSAFPPPLTIQTLACQAECTTALFKGEFGWNFSLEFSRALGADAQWQHVAGPLKGVNAVQELHHQASGAAGFYRVVSAQIN